MSEHFQTVGYVPYEDDRVLDFRVESWTRDGRTLQSLHAAVRNIHVARAAFDVSIKLNPGAIMTLRQGAHLIARHPPNR